MSASNVPALRFPGFFGEWNKVKLLEISSLITKGTTPKNFVAEGVNFIKIECFVGSTINKNKCLFIDEKTHTKELKRSILQEGDILFAIAGATIGKCSVVTRDVLPANTNQALSIIRLKDQNSLSFVYNNLRSDLMQKYILDNISVGAQPNLNLEQMGNFPFFLPSLPEQQKIASFLTAIDAKTELLTKKKALLEQYKKGVMQQLFSQQIRFKDESGNDFPEWEEKKISEMSDVSAGATPSTLKSEYWKGNIRWMNSGELNLKRVFEVENRITEKGLKSSSTKLLPKYCVLIGLAGQGRTRGTVAINMIELCTNQSIAAIWPNNKTYVSDFLYHNLDNRYDELRSLSTGEGGRGGLNLQIIKSLKIFLPSLPEQKKVATFLNSVDEKIKTVDQQIGTTQEYKKGLLQQLFV